MRSSLVACYSLSGHKDRKPGKLDGRIQSFVRQIRAASSAGTGVSAA